jgi:hypothetical protein
MGRGYSWGHCVENVVSCVVLGVGRGEVGLSEVVYAW